MKLGRILIIFVILLLVGGIAFLVFSVNARLKGNEYMFQLDAVLAAATVANNGEPLTEPDRAVIAEYEGKHFVIVPGNYLALSSYLRKDAAVFPFRKPDPEKAIRITVCGEAQFLIAPADETGDVVLVELATQGNSFSMRTDGGNQWISLVNVCTKGTYHDDNIPLD